jgi:hypothetical protein|tara:strand:- start:1292 stop:1831 length:540 start_codon:yes stop_codon:yes gene_type:complete
MRKFIAILLLGCFVIYHFGFYSFYLLYQYKIESDWNKKVHMEEFEHKTVLRIPLKLPYSFDQERFQIANIPFKKDGKSYRAIQKRFKDDTFEFLYVPDMATLKLEADYKNWVISLSPENSPDNKDGKVLTKYQLKDYLPRSGNFHCLKSILAAITYHDSKPGMLKAPHLTIITPPPWYS